MIIALILLFSFFAGYLVWFANAAMRSKNEATTQFEGAVAQLAGK